MGMPVKISDILLTAARQEAKGAHRSITGQIEHWASIGRATEMLMSHRELIGIKSLNDVFPSSPRREEIHRLLTHLVEKPHDRKQAHALILRAGTPVYETDPAHPGQIIQVSSDGTRKPGRLKNRRFVPGKPVARMKGGR